MASGEVVGLVGPNGAGKTTALRCISGIVRPTEGSIRVDGHDTIREERQAKQRLALLAELPNPYELLTIWEHLQFVAMAYGTEDVLEARGEDILRRMRLLDRRNDLVLTLSKGMKQKLAVACAFIHGATVYLLDEPLMGMDPKGQREFMEMVRETAEAGAAALVSTHILDTAERICDRILVLSRGRVIAEGGLDEIRRRAAVDGGRLEDAFLALTETEEIPE
jgi:ABC-2 type transport system ATP-binding protein